MSETAKVLKQNWDAELYEARHSFVWQFGESLVELLAPTTGERILDLGCGPGQLTAKIAEHGASVVGLDSSPEMIGQARQNFPHLHFVLKSATAMDFDDEFDAIFSNAALHWILDAAAAANGMYRALRKGGRLVAEFGGKGNIHEIERAIETVRARYLSSAPPAPALLSIGWRVRRACSKRRASKSASRICSIGQRLSPASREWRTGSSNSAASTSICCPPQRGKQALQETAEEVRPTLYRDGQWYADYRRLRIIAVKI